MAEAAVRTFVTIAAQPDQKQRAEAYRAALQQLLSAGDVDALKAFIDHMLSDDVALVISRQLLQVFAVEVAKLPVEKHKPLAFYALEKIQPRVVSFDESSTVLREELAKVLEAEEEWSKSAQILTGIDLDAGGRGSDPVYRLQKSIKIAMLYLEDDDAVNAETALKKASALIAGNKDESMELMYKTCYARILDAKRKFLESGQRYYELSQINHMVDESELEQALSKAITAAILAPAGPQRSRLLSTLYKDERSAHLPIFGFLQKVFLERILTGPEVDAFSKTLAPHQMALLPDDTTVLARAVSQHNLLSASRLYTNITTQELGSLLGVEPARAEAIAADMISEGRMLGSIDQVEGLIRFDPSADTLSQWDEQVRGLCNQVNAIVEGIVKAGIAVV